MSPTRQKIEWEPNIPVSVTLEFDGGKPVPARNGTQYLYWVDQNRSMFLDPDPHQQIQATGAKAGDTLEVTKTLRGKQIGWEVVHVVDAPNEYATDPTTAARRELASQPTRPPAGRPTAAPPIATPAPPAARTITTATIQLVEAFKASIDALTDARDYARTRGLDMPITPEMIRTTAISVYIGKTQKGAC